MHRFYWLLAICLSTSCVLKTENLQAATPTDKVRFYFNLSDSNGRIYTDIELYGNESPLHVANFLGYVDRADYDSSFIHRTMSFNQFGQPSALFVQGGSYKLPVALPNQYNIVTPGETVVNEFDPTNGLSNSVVGTLSAARQQDLDSASSGWFINVSENAGFDNILSPYTVFGQVTEGMSFLSLLPSFELFAPSLVGTRFETTPLLINKSTLAVIRSAVRIGLVEGDYNLDGVVDAADYSTWLATLGNSVSSGSRDLQADGNADGFVDRLDYEVWKNNIGATAPSGSGSSTPSAAVPEPATVLLLLVCLGTVGHRRRL